LNQYNNCGGEMWEQIGAAAIYGAHGALFDAALKIVSTKQ
jgi:hypothetical protein